MVSAPPDSVLLNRDTLRSARAAAAEDGVSVDEWVEVATRRRLVIRDGLDAVAEWECANGHLSGDEIAAARARVAARAGSASPG